MEEYSRRHQHHHPPPHSQSQSSSTTSPTAVHQHHPQTHLFSSTQLPLPNPPLHLQSQRYPSLHPSLSPSLPSAYPTPPWHPPSQSSAARHREEYPQSAPTSAHPASRHPTSRLDIPRSLQYQPHESRSLHITPVSAHPHPHPHPHPQHLHHHHRQSSPPNQSRSSLPQGSQTPPRSQSQSHSHPQQPLQTHISRLTPPSATTPDDALPPTSDFVKKLFKMLEDPAFHTVVSWGPEGDCFVVKDMNEFTKTILPKMFKHSNFASFVRQLNKYDFHKVKNAESTPGGDQAWTFKHPDFNAKRRDALENIKRKVPSQRKAQQNATVSTNVASSGPTCENVVSREDYENLVERLDDMTSRLQETERAYQTILSQFTAIQQTIAQQDSLLNQLTNYFVHFEYAKIPSPTLTQQSQHQAPISNSSGFASQPNGAIFLPRSETARLINTNGTTTEEDVARASFEQMNEISLRARDAGFTFPLNEQPSLPGGNSTGHLHSPVKQETVEIASTSSNSTKIDVNARRNALESIQQELKRIRTPIQQFTEGSTNSLAPRQSQSSGYDGYANSHFNGNKQNSPHQGLQVFTVGHIMPRGALEESGFGNTPNVTSWQYDGSTLQPITTEHSQNDGGPSQPEPYPNSSFKGNSSPPSPEGTATTPGTETRPALRVRRSTFVPAWSVPPRVLLVEDDAVSRRLSSKFLQVFGCTIDVAMDGDSAVNKMNLEKYDLVLMDIVMPKLDGVSATSLIRKFDPRTPIISMTSNSKPHDILYYFSQGMNDILPKPFTKEGLLGMLEKHLIHLKLSDAIRSHVPRGVGIPPLNDENFNQALVVSSQSYGLHGQPLITQTSGEVTDQDPKANPLAGMGISDEHYAMLMQNIVSVEGTDMRAAPGDASSNIPVFGFVSSSQAYNLSEKRPLEDPLDRDGNKRGRFEVLE